MSSNTSERQGLHTSERIPVTEAVGMVLAHDITEIRQNEFKGRAFKKGHVVRQEDVCHLQRLGKEHLFVLHVGDDEMHEDDAAFALARALMGEGVGMQGEPREGKINIVAERDGLLKINKEALLKFNMFGEVMCSSLHDNTVVKKGQVVAGTRAIPLVIKKKIVDQAVKICKEASPPRPPLGKGGRRGGVLEVKEMRKPKAGIVITGNEVYYGRVKDAFAPIIREKIDAYHGEIVGLYYTPDDGHSIEERLRELVAAGADLLVVTGGMSVDPDDVTRFAIRRLGVKDMTYGSAVLPGSMFLVAYIGKKGNGEREKRGHGDTKLSEAPNLRVSESMIPVLGIPACGMYHKITVLDLIVPRVLAGETIGRRELAELGHGGLCLNCKECRYPVCPFGK
ncbi:MAG: molybdopterin-binding protein [Nitrospirae bacterium]|nr:molybdopterin-binding protein [Nitrospirota bacterium]